MRNNEGTIDRLVRVVLGVVLLSQVFFGLKTPFGLIGLLPLLTGLVGVCPAYLPFGLRTCPAPAKGPEAVPKS